MNVSLQKAEALKRLAYLVSKGLHEDVLEFFKDGKLCFSDCFSVLPTLYAFEKDNGVSEEWLDKVRKVEEDYDIYVYHVSHCYTTFGELLNLLYVTSYQEEWEDDWIDLKQGYPVTYVINLSEPTFSEFGSIGIKVVAGGIIRVA